MQRRTSSGATGPVAPTAMAQSGSRGRRGSELSARRWTVPRSGDRAHSRRGLRQGRARLPLHSVESGRRRISRRQRQAIIGKTDHDVFPKEEADRFVARDREVLKSRQVEIFEEEPVHTPHNGLRFLRTRMIVICDDKEQPQYLLGISEDVTDQKLKSERIRHMAHHDGLTDLANRALFRQRLDAAMAEYPLHRAAAWCCSSSISTASSGSTTRSAIRPATLCCGCWPSACADARMTAIPWRGSAAMSSPSSTRLCPPARARPLGDRTRAVHRPAL